MATIRDLKRRYRLGLAEGKNLHLVDRSVAVPFSTGHPLYDAALTTKLKASATLNEAEHLRRSWNLVRKSSDAELSVLRDHRRDILNDYKMLAAVESWHRGDIESAKTFLNALPWRWRFAFPIVLIKPAAHMFTGWRKDLTFRLVENPNYEPLYAVFREFLERAPGVAILKYQATIKQSAALMRFRFEGERERAIHNLCFDRGRKFPTDFPELEPIPTYIRAREFIKKGDVESFLKTLEDAPAEIPITSYMGLLGSQKIRLYLNHPLTERLQNYAIRCATAVECLLRLVEWGDWMTEEHAEEIGAKVRHTVIDRGIDIPFFKVLKGFINAHPSVKRMLLKPLLIPLLHHFGATTAKRLHDQPVSFVMPGNMLGMMSFLLYAVLASATETTLMLLFDDGVEKVDALDVNDVAEHLVDTREDFETWLKATFGGLTTIYGYQYDYGAMAKTVGKLDDEHPICLDVPFAQSVDVLHALLPKETVYTFTSPFGAPGEVCVRYEYYQHFLFEMPGRSYGYYSRESDSASQRFAEFLDCTNAFSKLAEVA